MAQRRSRRREPVERNGRVAALIDIGPAVHQRAGLSRYAERLTAAMLEEASPELRLALFYNRHSGHKLPVALQNTPVFSIPAGQYRWRLSVLATQIMHVPYRGVNAFVREWQTMAGVRSQAIYHATEHLLPRLTCPTVLTVHDLIFERLPQYHTRANRMFLKLGMPLFVRNATMIIAVSRRTKLDLLARYRLSEERIRVVYEGIDEVYAPASEDCNLRTRKRYNNGEPYLLMVGAIEPRKNHIAAIQALEKLHEAGYPHRLLIAGGMGWMYEPILRRAESSFIADRITFLGYVPERELPALYSAADCFLQPSRYEGFGFTVLEAMACGTPVICSNAGSLPEVADKAAILVNPDNVDGLAQSIRNVLEQPRLAEAMVRKGLANAARFNWRSCAHETQEVYGEAASIARAWKSSRR